MENEELIRTLNAGLPIDIPANISYEELHTRLSAYINELIRNDFEKLVTYLYRIDVSEAKLKTLLHQFPDQDAGHIIASLIIERQEQKLKIRQHSDNYRNSQRDNSFEDEEKW